MTNTTYTLQLAPKGYKVVPEEPTNHQVSSAGGDADYARIDYEAMVKAAPPLNTPPVLRWEKIGTGCCLYVGNKVLASISVNNKGGLLWQDGTIEQYTSVEEARRAAEKALGFPDWLVIEEV